MSKPIHKTLLGCFASSLILILFDCRNASLTDPMNSDRSKISSAAGLAAAPTAYLDITGSPYNAVPNDNTDDTAAINQCAADAKAQGKGVYIPNGEFRHSGVLIFDSVDVVGQSASGAKLLATAPATASCKMLGTLAKVRNLSLVGTATSRSQADSSCGILASSVANITISGVVISGMAGAGMKLNNVNGGTVSGNAVTGTFADGIHMTEKSRNLVVQNNSVTGTGDDCISIVSYVKDGGKCTNILISGNAVGSNVTSGRGIVCIGGDYHRIQNNQIANALNAGIMIAGEGPASYDTYGINTITVSGNTISGSGSTSKGHGAIHLNNSTAYAIGTVNLTGNTISHSRKSGLCISSGGINTVNFNNNTVDGTGASQGVSVNPAFSGSLSFNGGTVKNTQEGALYWTPSSGGSLSVQGVAFQKINKSGTSSVDVITIGAGAMTSLRIQNCVHSQPDFPLQRFIEEQADAATQIFAGNQSTEDSFINGQVVPTI